MDNAAFAEQVAFILSNGAKEVVISKPYGNQ